MEKSCVNCLFEKVPSGLYPCVDCGSSKQYDLFQPKNKGTIEMTNKKEFTYTDAVYELIKDECKDMDSIYEDYIISLVGNCGLAALKRAGLVESCGILNCRQLYVLCDK
jgi:hypothetical protein